MAFENRNLFLLTTLYRGQLMAKVQHNAPLRLYRTLKDRHEFEPYLDRVSCVSARKSITEFRCGNTKLRVHTGRIHGERYEERKCRFCMDPEKLEDETHILLECECFQAQSQKLIKHLQRQFPFFNRMDPAQKMKVIFTDKKLEKLFGNTLQSIFSEMEAYLF